MLRCTPSYHCMSIIIMAGVAAWDCFQEHQPDKFPSLFTKFLDLKREAGRPLQQHELVAYLHFTINVFQVRHMMMYICIGRTVGTHYSHCCKYMILCHAFDTHAWLVSTLPRVSHHTWFHTSTHMMVVAHLTPSSPSCRVWKVSWCAPASSR